MKHICLQENNYDCGLACIKMMLAHYHKNKKLLNLDKEKINAKYSLYQLKLYAEKYNLLTEGIEFENKEEIYNFENSLIQICINNVDHFVIFEKKRKDTIYIIDPKIGRVKLKKDEFLEYFTSYALVKKEVIKLDKIQEVDTNSNINYIIVYSTFLVLDFGSLILLSYLEGDPKYLFHSFLIILTLILLLISKILLINRHVSSIDKIIKNILNSDQKLNFSTRKGLLSYKVYSIKYLYGKINNIFICLFIGFILLINHIINLPILIILSIITFFFSKSSVVNDNSINYKLSILENEFFRNSNNEVYDQLIITSKKLQNSRSIGLIINQLVIMSLVTILNNLSEINSFEFVLFHAMYYFVFLSRLSYLFKDSECDGLEYRKYASTFNYLRKIANKENVIAKIDKNDD